MRATFLLGPAGSGKTFRCLQEARAALSASAEGLPLLFHGANLVWVPGIGIAAEYACEAGREGLKPALRVAGKALRVLE